jgi:3-oxoacyl-[acyl-carrier protein] reductase
MHHEPWDFCKSQALAELAPEGGSNLAGHVVDVSKHDSVSAAWDAIGPAHILVNSAGITRDGWLVKMNPGAQWDDVMAVNLKGTFLMTQGFAK